MADTPDSITVRITADTSAVRDALAADTSAVRDTLARTGVRRTPLRAQMDAAFAFEEAFARVKALNAATAEHMNALADLVEAGVQPWQMRFLAGSLTTRVRVVPTAVPRGRHV